MVQPRSLQIVLSEENRPRGQPVPPIKRMSQRILALAPLLLLAVPACFNSDESFDSPDPNATANDMMIVQVQNGFGRMLPHTVHAVDPTTGIVSSNQVVEIRSIEDLLDNPPSELNPVIAPTAWHAQAVTPSNNAGNHFVNVVFSRSIDIDSVLDATAGGLSNNGLTGAIQVVAYDPNSGLSEQISGRGFIDGFTYFGNFANGPALERWVAPDSSNPLNQVSVLDVTRDGAVVTPGAGYPGSPFLSGGNWQTDSYSQAGSMVGGHVFTFVADQDDDLSTYETFPANKVIRIVISDSVLSDDAQPRQLADPGIATSVVAQDNGPPLTLLDGVAGSIVTVPGHLDINVDCDEDIRWKFSESVQPHSLGALPSNIPPSLSNQFTVEFLPGVPPGMPAPGQTVKVPYTVLPVSPYDFTEFVLTPTVPFPGSDPNGSAALVTVTYFSAAAEDLFGNDDPNSSETDSISFEISGACPGLVNAPVAPGALYLASNGGGSSGGIRVLDLDGFGQGTGDPAHNFNGYYDQLDVSKFPFNPNLTSPQGSFMFPPLSHELTTIAGGSQGVFTLTKDSALKTQLVTNESVGTIGDMALGHPLDLMFNNWDCLSGGQNLCANAAFQLNPLSAVVFPGNSISHAPHPNPPRISLAPSCYAPMIMGEEPTFGGNPLTGVATNLLVPGDAFGTFGGQGPSGLLTSFQTYTGFYGPSPTSTSCPQFSIRQQVGQVLYVLDSKGDRVVAMNSNRMTPIDVISVPDPRDLAISPDLNLLAVSNHGTNTVTFIDTDPNSPNFHTIINTTSLVDPDFNRIGEGPGEIVWQPDDEDILVVCEDSDSMAIISARDLAIRKILPGVAQPRFLSVSNRDLAAGFSTGLYYSFIISEDGSTTIFESGPDGVQGIGFDTFIGIPSLTNQSGFDSPMAIQPDPATNLHGAYIAYRKNGKGSVARLQLKDAPIGPRPIALNGFVPDPNFRTKEFAIAAEWTGIFSSSTIVDLAVDDLSNLGGFPSVTTIYGTGKTTQKSSKSLSRVIGGAQVAVSTPKFLFVANANGKLDVVQMATGNLYVPSIDVPGVQVLCHYWRQ